MLRNSTIHARASTSIGYSVLLILALSGPSMALEYSELKPPGEKEIAVIEESDDLYDAIHISHREDYPELIERLNALLPKQEQVFGKYSAYVCCTLDALAVIYKNQKKPNLVLHLAERALPIKMKYLGADAPDTTIEVSRIAFALNAMNKYDDAIVILKDHLSKLKHPSESHSAETMIYYELGLTYQALKNYPEAENWLAQAASDKLKYAPNSGVYPSYKLIEDARMKVHKALK